MEQQASERNICGFWRRVIALLVDLIILWLFGTMIGLIAFDFLSKFGMLGRVLGFVVALLYLGFGNSSVLSGANHRQEIATSSGLLTPQVIPCRRQVVCEICYTGDTFFSKTICRFRLH